MRILFGLLGVAAMAGTAQFASAEVITQLVTTGGLNDSFINNGTDVSSTTPTPSLEIVSFVAGGVTFDTFVGIETTDSEGSVQRLFGTSDDDGNTLVPDQGLGSQSAILSDLNLTTGTLNTNASDAGGDLRFDLAGTNQTLTADSTLFIFANGGGAGSVNAVDDASGNSIGPGNADEPGELTFFNIEGFEVGTLAADFYFDGDDVAPNLLEVRYSRRSSNGGGGDLNRTVSGAIFTLGDVVLADGASISDFVRFGIESVDADILDAGIVGTAVTVPEPSSAIILVGGLGAFLIRRRRNCCAN